MKNIIKLGFTLALFAVISCVLLAFVNNITAPVISDLEAKKEQEALKMVLPNATKYIPAGANLVSLAISNCGADIGSIKISQIFKAVDADEKTIGYAANITGPTFESSSILLGLDTDMTITGVNILQTTDTPGGQKLRDYRTSKVTQGKTWTEQFAGVTPLVSYVTDTDYEIISGATISSAGIASMIKAGTDVINAFAKADK